MVASARKSENQSRIAAIDAARDAILERAEKDPARMMQGLLANPKLTFALKSFEDIIDILLAKGQKDDLVKLSKMAQTPPMQRSQLRKKLLAAGFEDLCEGKTDVSLESFSPARLAAEAAFAQLCTNGNSASC